MRLADLPGGFLRNLAQCAVLGLVHLAAGVSYCRFRYGWKHAMVWPPILFVAIAGLCWQAVATFWVPEPYLDEIFHIPQAQKYCQAKWLEWDDKITTPPGLYVLSNALLRFMWFITGDCSAQILRMTNWLAITSMPLVALQCRRLIESRLAERDSSGQQPRRTALSIYAIHTGLNTALFPLLFFFSGLYYTDVFSTLVVLVAYWNHLTRVGTEPVSWRSDALVVLLGAASLLMRQTNVFWVVAFMGGLEAVHAVKVLRPPPTSFGQSDTQTRFKFYIGRYAQGEVHDPLLDKAGLEDVFLCALSIAIAVVGNPFRVLRQIWAHIMVAILFMGFVLWNGSVVLGDKSNHVATVHLPQMLYIWPLFAFFSAPLLLSAVLTPIFSIFGELRTPIREWEQPPRSPFSSFLNTMGYAALAPISLAIVQYNTIIHPFTLADNRHYMFYIFRYSILRAPWVRYALVPAYNFCAIICWKVLGGTGTMPRSAGVTSWNRKGGQRGSGREETNITPPVHNDLSSPASTSHQPPSLSTALLWLVTTTLSLVSAPLVEPRYFILPWVFWRLLMPSWSLPQGLQQGGALQLGRKYDLRLWLETAWFVVINVVTMYIFITRPFYWKNEDGVQRFMW